MAASSPAVRLQVVDALRAFALLGIIIAHTSNEYIAGPTPPGYSSVLSPLDAVVDRTADILTFGKFFTIFSFLFGLSFGIQMSGAAARGERFSLRFLWRLAILFAIGFVHSIFYGGDILGIYALLGVLLLACQSLGRRALLIAGTLLVLNVPLQITRVAGYLNPPTAVEREAQKQNFQKFQSQAARNFNIKRSGTLQDNIGLNVSSGITGRLFFQLFTGRLFITMGLFLLGLAASRTNLFADSPEHRRFFRRMLIVCGVIAVLATTVAWTLNPAIMGDTTQLPVLIGAILFDVHQAALSAVYVAGFTLLYWSGPSRVLSALVPAGQMGLTVYLTQTAFGLLIFYGYGIGLMGKMGAALAMAPALGFYVLQIWLAQIWMSRFRVGPVEWLWRSLTYGRPQPLRRVRESAAAANA